MERQDEDPITASGTEISRNIAKLAERRTDIFGIGEKGAEQTIIGKKLGEEERTMPRSDPKNIWDGQQATIDATTRAAQQSVCLEQQISEIQRQHGYNPNQAAAAKPAMTTASATAPSTTAQTQMTMPTPPVCNSFKLKKFRQFLSSRQLFQMWLNLCLSLEDLHSKCRVHRHR
jgi:hypothetical protein